MKPESESIQSETLKPEQITWKYNEPKITGDETARTGSITGEVGGIPKYIIGLEGWGADDRQGSIKRLVETVNRRASCAPKEELADKVRAFLAIEETPFGDKRRSNYYTALKEMKDALATAPTTTVAHKEGDSL